MNSIPNSKMSSGKDSLNNSNMNNNNFNNYNIKNKFSNIINANQMFNMNFQDNNIYNVNNDYNYDNQLKKERKRKNKIDLGKFVIPFYLLNKQELYSNLMNYLFEKPKKFNVSYSKKTKNKKLQKSNI